jgi:hypothetical protein
MVAASAAWREGCICGGHMNRLLVGAVLTLASPGWSQEAVPPPAPNPLEERLIELERSHRALERKLEIANRIAEETSRTKGVTVTAAPGKGFSIITGDNRFGMTVRARAQVRDTVGVDNKNAGTNEINIKTARLWIQGHVLVPELLYMIQLAFGGNDFEAGNASPVFDAFIEYNRLRDLNVRVGQYFVPFDRARTIKEFALQFVDRQQPVQEFTLDRDVGIMFSSQNLFGSRGILAYNLFVGGGDGKNRFGAQSIGFLYILRLAVRPWGAFDDDMEGDLLRLKRPRLAIAFAGAYNHGTNRQKSTFGNTLQGGGLDYGHAAADLVFKHSGFSLLAEVVYRQALQDYVGPDTAREYSRSGWGWFVQAGMMVHRLVEIVARYDQIYAFDGTDPTLIKTVQDAGQQAGAGFNIYLNGHQFKIQSDYFYTFGYDADKGRHQVRVQLDATF